jgi:hypothetical protein
MAGDLGVRRAGLLEAFWLQSQNGETLAPVTVSGCLRCTVGPFYRCASASLAVMKDQRAAKTIFRQSMNWPIKLTWMLALQNLSIDGRALRANGSPR